MNKITLNMYIFALFVTLWAFSAVKATEPEEEEEELGEKRGYFLNQAHKRDLGENEEAKRYLVHSFVRPHTKRGYFTNEALKGLADDEEKRDSEFFNPEYLEGLDKRGFFTREMLDHLGDDGKKRGYFTQEMLDRLGEDKKKRGYFSREMMGSLGQDGDKRGFFVDNITR